MARPLLVGVGILLGFVAGSQLVPGDLSADAALLGAIVGAIIGWRVWVVVWRPGW